jgi:putative ABC transport system permease protein
MSSFISDVRYGLRMLRKNPGFTSIAVLALALGIGANTALFSAVYGVLLKPLPYAQGKDLVVLEQRYPKINREDVKFSVKEIHDYREQNQTLSQIEEYHTMSFILLNRKEPDNVTTGVVSARFFDLLGVKPLLGRTFRESDDRPGADPVLVLSYGYWKSKHGGDVGIIGKQFKMNDKVHTVVGVLPHIPQYPNENDVYMPTVACPTRSSPQFMENRNGRMMSVFGRLKPGASTEAAQADLGVIARRLEQAYPTNYPQARGYTAGAHGLQERLTRHIRPMLLVLLGTAGFVLLIACANVANLALARMARREQELAVRVALGANRFRLVRQLLTESTLLSLLGGALGLLFASSCLQLLVTFAARFTSRAGEVAINGWVLLFTLAISVATGILFGCIPAFSSRLDLVTALKEGSNASTVKSGLLSMRSLLVVGQVAFSFMLLIGAGLLLRSFLKLQRVDPGFKGAENVLTMTIPLNFTKYQQAADIRRFFDQLLPILENQPGIEAVAVTGGPPLTGRPGQLVIDIEGRTLSGNEAKPLVDPNIASPETFKLLGVPLLSGRFFTAADHAQAPPVVLINRSFARHYFANEDPIGKRLSADNGANWATIVGVVGDVKAYGLDKEVVDMVYQPFAQAPNGVSLMLRTSGNPANYVRQVQEAIYAIDPEQPISNVKTLDELRGDSLAANRLTAILLALFAGLALAIAATGLSGVIAFIVSHRTREIGIRMALGAQSTDVLSMILAYAAKMIGMGLIIGVAGALAGSRVLRNLLFNTPNNDVTTFVLVAAVFMLVALIASYIPARRATQVDPLVALRTE